jgi:beta-galactosidase
MCDELGFYVINEADLETHGLGYNYGDWYWDYWAYICDAPEWKDACVDRARLLYERDKNHPCVVMWSLGNESGCGENHRAMAQYIRQRNPKNNIKRRTEKNETIPAGNLRGANSQ